MSEKHSGSLILRGVIVEQCLLYASNGGQPTVEINLSADWSDTVCEQMEWSFEPQGFCKGALEGSLFGVNMIMEPNKKELKDYRFDLPINKVSKFVHAPSFKDGEVVSRRLTYRVTAPGTDDTMLALQKWVEYVCPSDARAQCKIKFTPETQTELPLEGEQRPLPETEEAPTRGRRRSLEAVQ